VAGVTALLMAASTSFVYLTDPFQVLRRSKGAPNFYDVAQFQIPGIARHYPYDAVVAGTSISNNFRAEDLAGAFGWHAINFSIAGSTVSEQRAVLEAALATGKARNVLWGLDTFAFTRDRGQSFPYYLYRELGWRTAPYFLNLGALAHGVSTLMLPEAKRMSLAEWTDKSAWDRQYVYGRAQVLTAWDHRRAMVVPDLPETPALAEEAVNDRVASLIAANPGVQFRVVLPPYSVLYQKFLLEERPKEFDAGCWLGSAIVRRVAALPNARVHDFGDANEVTHDLDAFKDLLHFSGEVSRRIIGDVAAGRRQVTPGAFDRACALIKTDAAAYQPPAGRE
jgi:hypothetical protein